MKLFRRKKKEPVTLAQIVSHYRIKKERLRKLSKKDLAVEIDNQTFYYIDIPLREKNDRRIKTTSERGC